MNRRVYVLAAAAALLALAGAAAFLTRPAARESAPPPGVITQTERSPATLNDRYGPFKQISEPGPVIAGLAEDLIPQGAAWWPEKQWLVSSSYIKAGKPSMITILDSKTGKLVKSLQLRQEDGSWYNGHAGGIAISRENAWIANAGLLFRIPLGDLLKAPDGGEVRFADRFPVDSRASFVEYSDGVLWVGEFYHPTADYKTDPRHHLTNREGKEHGAWVAGYKLDPASEKPAAQPSYVLSIPNQIQGMTFTADSVFLSRSYGRNNDSHLFRYDRPDLAGTPHQMAGELPVWFLDKPTATTVMPPMSEEIVTDGAGRLYVLFESGANEYRHNGTHPYDRWVIVNLKR